MKKILSQSYFNLAKIAGENPQMEEDPCWSGYQMVGMKKGKGGKMVPNCVPAGKKKKDKKRTKKASQSFNEWASQELKEEHHEDSLRDGVLTFEEWMQDEMSEPEHAQMGQGFSFDDWAREEIEEEESHQHEDQDDCGCYDADNGEEIEDESDDYSEECDTCHRMSDDDVFGEIVQTVQKCEDCGKQDDDCECKMMHKHYMIDKDGNIVELHDSHNKDDMMGDWGKKVAASFGATKTAKKTPAWQRSEGKSESGGLNEKGRKSYNRATGGNLQAPVTEKNPTGKRKARRKSFCARSKGQMKMHNIDCSKTPDKRICKARRRWKC